MNKVQKQLSKAIIACTTITSLTMASPHFFAQTTSAQAAQVEQQAIHFKDVPTNHWATSAIFKAIDEGLVKGYPDGTFRPNSRVTTAEFVTILARSYGIGGEIKSEGNFNQNVSAFMKQKGYPFSNQPQANVTRSQVAETIAKSNGLSLSGNDAIKFLLVNGLANGKVEGGLATVENYKGSDSLTRAESVTFIQNLKTKGLKGDGNLTGLITTKAEIDKKYAEMTKNAQTGNVKITPKTTDEMHSAVSGQAKNLGYSRANNSDTSLRYEKGKEYTIFFNDGVGIQFGATNNSESKQLLVSMLTQLGFPKEDMTFLIESGGHKIYGKGKESVGVDVDIRDGGISIRVIK